MAKNAGKITLPPPARAFSEQDWKADRTKRIVRDALALHEEKKASIISDLGKDNGLYWSSVEKFSVAREKVRMIGYYFSSLETMETTLADTNEEILERAKTLKGGCLEKILRISGGAHNSGDLNSSSSFSRFQAAAELSAAAELFNDLKMLGEI